MSYINRIMESMQPHTFEQDDLQLMVREWQLTGDVETAGEYEYLDCELCGKQELASRYGIRTRAIHDRIEARKDAGLPVEREVTDGHIWCGSKCILRYSIATQDEVKAVYDAHMRKVRIGAVDQVLALWGTSSAAEGYEGEPTIEDVTLALRIAIGCQFVLAPANLPFLHGREAASFCRTNPARLARWLDQRVKNDTQERNSHLIYSMARPSWRKSRDFVVLHDMAAYEAWEILVQISHAHYLRDQEQINKAAKCVQIAAPIVQAPKKPERDDYFDLYDLRTPDQVEADWQAACAEIEDFSRKCMQGRKNKEADLDRAAILAILDSLA